jgi:hypothetical protein
MMAESWSSQVVPWSSRTSSGVVVPVVPPPWGGRPGRPRCGTGPGRPQLGTSLRPLAEMLAGRADQHPSMRTFEDVRHRFPGAAWLALARPSTSPRPSRPARRVHGALSARQSARAVSTVASARGAS